MLVPLTEDVEGVAQNLIALDLGLQPVGPALFYLEGLAILQIFAESLDHLVEHSIGLALVHFVGANLIDQVVDDIAEVHGVEHAETKVDRELQPGLA